MGAVRIISKLCNFFMVPSAKNQGSAGFRLVLPTQPVVGFEFRGSDSTHFSRKLATGAAAPKFGFNLPSVLFRYFAWSPPDHWTHFLPSAFSRLHGGLWKPR